MEIFMIVSQNNAYWFTLHHILASNSTFLLTLSEDEQQHSVITLKNIYI